VAAGDIVDLARSRPGYGRGVSDSPADHGSSEAERFFDQYPHFYRTAGVGSQTSRLQERYRVLIEDNRDVIDGKRMLDIASHDGRWSFAALMHGAKHVRGIEGRSGLVETTRSIFDEYGIARKRYRIDTGDVLAVVPTIERGSVDTVFLLGFLYHTMHPMLLLNEIARIAPATVIIDTNVLARTQRPIIRLIEEDPTDPGRAIAATEGATRALVGLPSPSALRMLLRHAGYDFEFVDWAARGITDWSTLEDYRDGRRVTVRATPRTIAPDAAAPQQARRPPRSARSWLRR
jgi:hypothetical protein